MVSELGRIQSIGRLSGGQMYVLLDGRTNNPPLLHGQTKTCRDLPTSAIGAIAYLVAEGTINRHLRGEAARFVVSGVYDS